MILVLSALAGVTDALVEAADRLEQQKGVDAIVTGIARRHRAMADALSLDPQATETAATRSLRDTIRRARSRPDGRARVVAAGESLSCALAHRFLESHGLRARRRPSTRYLIASGADEPSRRSFALAPGFAPRDSTCLIVEGFSTVTGRGRVQLLGRGGSDQTATVLAHLVRARSCEIWTDVTGVFTSDPRTDADARHIPVLTYDALELMAAAGAKVLQTEAVAPARQAGIPIVIRSTFDPAHPGTLVVASRAPGWTISAGA